MAYYNEPIQDYEEYQLAVGGVYDEQKEKKANEELASWPNSPRQTVKDIILLKDTPSIARLILLRQIKAIIHAVCEEKNKIGYSVVHDILNRVDIKNYLDKRVPKELISLLTSKHKLPLQEWKTFPSNDEVQAFIERDKIFLQINITGTTYTVQRGIMQKAYTNVKNFQKPLQQLPSAPLNQIFYGPPGTGKTFHTIDAALKILDPSSLDLSREEQKARFDELVANNKICFVTFHQSFSYEDFVEGLRPVVNENGNISYEVKTGIFKDMCDLARSRVVQSLGASFDLLSKKVWKMSLGNSAGDDAIYEYCRDNNQILMGWGDDIDFSQCRTKAEIVEKLRDIGYGDTASSGGSIVNQFIHEMKVGDIVIVSKGNTKIRAIAEIVGDYQCVEDNPSGYHQSREVSWLSQFDPYTQLTVLTKRKTFSQRTLHGFDLNGEEKQNLENLIAQSVETSDKPTPHVLIIDEINRGNISGIFGELITLIEPSKRAGAKEALTVQLPYSGEPFSVPDNLYIIGTMNTADRSLTGLDIALRRRFSFTEMPPRPDLLEEKKIKGTNITLSEMLEGMNARIELLLDRDHCLGHAPFMHLEDGEVTTDQLAPIFAGVIIPLLQEYFFDDWHKIQLVLNDHQKAPVNQLVKEKSASYLEGMEEYANRKLWEVNHDALKREDFYTGIVSVQKQAVAMPAEDLDE